MGVWYVVLFVLLCFYCNINDVWFFWMVLVFWCRLDGWRFVWCILLVVWCFLIVWCCSDLGVIVVVWLWCWVLRIFCWVCICFLWRLVWVVLGDCGLWGGFFCDFFLLFCFFCFWVCWCGWIVFFWSWVGIGVYGCVVLGWLVLVVDVGSVCWCICWWCLICIGLGCVWLGLVFDCMGLLLKCFLVCWIGWCCGFWSLCFFWIVLVGNVGRMGKLCWNIELLYLCFFKKVEGWYVV